MRHRATPLGEPDPRRNSGIAWTSDVYRSDEIRTVFARGDHDLAKTTSAYDPGVGATGSAICSGKYARKPLFHGATAVQTTIDRTDNTVQDLMIEIQQVSKRYGSIWALRDITLHVKAGTRLTVIGPNGSGKTTLIRILARLSSPSSGSLKLFGRDLSAQGDEARKQIGVVSHTSFLYPSLTAAENLIFYANMFGVSRTPNTIESLLNQVGLLDRQHDLVRTFSRGMQQRLAIARAILHQPLLLLLDEPYSGLDGTAVKLLQRILTNIHREGRTIILTTHHYQSGLEFSDQAAVLLNGRLVYYGLPAHIRIAAKNPTLPGENGEARS